MDEQIGSASYYTLHSVQNIGQLQMHIFEPYFFPHPQNQM